MATKKEKISKEKIISAFLTVSFEKSPSGTALSDIADNLGIKKASLYNHYENREAIFSDVLNFCGTFLENLELPTDLASVSEFAVFLFRLFDSKEIEAAEVFSLIESEKFFNDAAFDISEKFKIRLIKSLKSMEKISEKVRLRGEFFVAAVLSLIGEFIAAKKMMSRNGEEIEFSEEKLKILLDF